MKWIPWIGGGGLVLMLFSGCAVDTAGYYSDGPSYGYYDPGFYNTADVVIAPYGYGGGYGYRHHGWSGGRHGHASHGTVHAGGHSHGGHGGGHHHH